MKYQCGRYVVTYQSFQFNGAFRQRPIRVVGEVPPKPVHGQARGDEQPIALYEGTTLKDTPLHNTVRGHLVGLDSLGGSDDSYNMVPMYSHFNISGYKTQIENWIKANAQQKGVSKAVLTMNIHYPPDNANADQRIPRAFDAALEITSGTATNAIQTGQVLHPVPALAYEQPITHLKQLISKATARMVSDDWWVEDHVETDASARLALHEQLVVYPKELGLEFRPYAVIDYLLYGGPRALRNKLFSITAAVTNGDIQPDYQNGGSFSVPQKKLMYAVNLARNDGYYKSDDRSDYVYKGKEHRYEAFNDYDQAKKYRHAAKVNYRAMILADGMSANGILIRNGGHQKPEVDHVIPKAGKYVSGCNAYSNARIISGYLNNNRRLRR